MATYKLTGPALRVEGHLQADSDHELQSWCRELMAGDYPELVIDLSRVESITSSCIGIISAFWVEVLTQERKLDLIVSAPVRHALTIAGFHHVFSMRDAGAPG